MRAVSVRRPVLDYAGVILLGEDLLKEDCKNVLSQLYDNPELPYAIPIIMAAPSAEKVLKTLAIKTADLSGNIDNMLRSTDRLSLPKALSLPQFYNLLLSSQKDPYLPCFSENNGDITLDGVGVFKENKLSALLKKDAALGLGILFGSAKDYPLILDENTTVYLRRTNVNLKKDEICLKLYADTTSRRPEKELEKATVKIIKDYVRSALFSLENAESDVLGVRLISPVPLKTDCRIKELIP